MWLDLASLSIIWPGFRTTTPLLSTTSLTTLKSERSYLIDFSVALDTLESGASNNDSGLVVNCLSFEDTPRLNFEVLKLVTASYTVDLLIEYAF